MPVKELITFDLEQQKVELNTTFGPVPLGGVRGWCDWTEKGAVVTFRADRIVFGPITINKAGKDGEAAPSKTYTFFYCQDGIAAARSSAGGIALLKQFAALP